MKINIGNIITGLRHEKNVTQDQLANHVGVSVAAVSKWETDNSYPDIALLPSIAEFFCVSIDALMGYSVTDRNLSGLKDELKKYAETGDYKTAIPLYEDALRKFPNDFELNLEMGSFKTKEATASSPPDIDIAKEAIRYLEKAKMVVPGYYANDSIDQNIAHVYGAIGDYERAIHILVETNYKSHELQIAGYLIKLKKYDEAKQRLQSHLWNTAFEFAMQTSYLGDCFKHQGDNRSALQLCEMNAAFHEFFTLNDTPNYADIICTWDYVRLAKEYKFQESTDKMWHVLLQAARHAIRFDEKPSYNNEDINFIQGLKGTVTNNSSQNACAPLIRDLEKSFSDLSSDFRYTDLIEKLNKSKSDKKQSGVWA